METLTQMVNIMAMGGGVGFNLSSLRPKNAIAHTVGGISSGSVSWGGLYSYTTGLVIQGGNRRGALMLILDDWHPDLLEFINSKREAGKITNANISVFISDAFMEAVENDEVWRFVFPDTTYPDYDEIWTGDLNAWKDANLPLVHHSEMPAREIWNQICQSAWASAEPGCLFIDRAREQSNSYYFSNLIATNPCSEIYLGGWGVCCLSHICLQNMVKTDDTGHVSVDWLSIKKTTQLGVRFLDNVIDVTPYRYEENRQVQQLGERRIGLGTMGFAELLIKLGVRYGSDESVELAEKIQKMIAYTAYEESSDLALEKGSFPEFDAKRFLASGFCQLLPDHLRAKIREDGMRNVACLTAAPTGTVGTLMSTSTGIEPFFSFVNYRKSRLGVFEERHPILDGVDELQDYHVTAMDGVSPEDHVRILCAFAKYNDQSISKTVNIKSDATVEDVSNIYKYVYKNGAKGCAIYRDGSRNEQVLFKPSTCNECGEEAVITENDCSTCQACGWSACST